MERVLKLVTGSDHYGEWYIQKSKTLKEANEELSKMFQKLRVKDVYLTSVGNSIGSGHSQSDLVRPLLVRNDSLKEVAAEHGISVHYDMFARPQNNSEVRVREWLDTNVSKQTMNEWNRMDWSGGTTSMNYFGDSATGDGSNITVEEIDTYFPETLSEDYGFLDVVKRKGKRHELANILVYNGMTGTFLDNLTRGGKHKNLSGFKKDRQVLTEILRTIYHVEPNTQVYVCGIPEILAVKYLERPLINSKIRKMCEMFPNVSYVQPAPAHFLYNQDGKLVLDIHHNQHEYLTLNQNIVSSICQNYVGNQFQIMMDQCLSDMSTQVEKKSTERKANDESVSRVMNLVINTYRNKLNAVGKPIEPQLQKFKKYALERYPHYYFYIPKKTIKKNLDHPIYQKTK